MIIISNKNNQRRFYNLLSSNPSMSASSTSTTTTPAAVVAAPAARPLLVTGDDNGLVKIWDLTQSHPTLQVTFGTQTRNRAVQALCWYDKECTRVLASFADGTTQCLPTTQHAARQHSVTNVDRQGICAATSSSMAMIGGRLVMATKNQGVYVLDPDEGTKSNFKMHLTRPKHLEKSERENNALDAVHIHRRYALVAGGGKSNELCVWDVSTAAEGGSTKLGNPIFVGENVDEHILGVDFPTYITGCCVVDYHVFTTVTAYHQVRFYDRRLGRKPVQEFSIERESQNRRPTNVLQWNKNKYLIGEAGGDLHLYDTRRGFSSRAKLRGADGSVRCIAKHPDNLPIVATTGLDRVARIFHVPTGQQIQQMFLKQMGTCCLLSKGSPAQTIGTLGAGGMIGSGTAGLVADWRSSTSRKVNAAAFGGWDEMMPVNDDLNEEEEFIKKTTTSTGERNVIEVKLTSSAEEAKKVKKEVVEFANRDQEEKERKEEEERIAAKRQKGRLLKDKTALVAQNIMREQHSRVKVLKAVRRSRSY